MFIAYLVTVKLGRETARCRCVPRRLLTVHGPPPSDLSLDLIRDQPLGQLFESITRGIRNMPAYGDDIANDDRWAIVLYVRAFKRNGNITHYTVPAE